MPQGLPYICCYVIWNCRAVEFSVVHRKISDWGRRGFGRFSRSALWVDFHFGRCISGRCFVYLQRILAGKLPKKIQQKQKAFHQNQPAAGLDAAARRTSTHCHAHPSYPQHSCGYLALYNLHPGKTQNHPMAKHKHRILGYLNFWFTAVFRCQLSAIPTAIEFGLGLKTLYSQYCAKYSLIICLCGSYHGCLQP